MHHRKRIISLVLLMTKIRKKGLSLILLVTSSMLIDGRCDAENCSQVALTAVERASYVIRRSGKIRPNRCSYSQYRNDSQLSYCSWPEEIRTLLFFWFLSSTVPVKLFLFYNTSCMMGTMALRRFLMNSTELNILSVIVELIVSRK